MNLFKSLFAELSLLTDYEKPLVNQTWLKIEINFNMSISTFLIKTF